MQRSVAWVPGFGVRAVTVPRMEARTLSSHRGRGGRGRGWHGRGGRGRGRVRGRGGGGYKGTGAPLTPVAKGFRYFKHSFLEDPWRDLGAVMKREDANPEEIGLDVDEEGVLEEAEEDCASADTGRLDDVGNNNGHEDESVRPS